MGRLDGDGFGPFVNCAASTYYPFTHRTLKGGEDAEGVLSKVWVTKVRCHREYLLFSTPRSPAAGSTESRGCMPKLPGGTLLALSGSGSL